MRITILGNNVTIEYRKEEWQLLEDFYIRHGLEKYTTHNLFDRGITADVYRYTSSDEVLLRRVVEGAEEELGSLRIRLIDNINKPFLRTVRDEDNEETILYFNLAIFRIIPKESTFDERYIIRVNIDDEGVYIPLTLLSDIKKVIVMFTKNMLKRLKEVKYKVRITFDIEAVGA